MWKICMCKWRGTTKKRSSYWRPSYTPTAVKNHVKKLSCYLFFHNKIEKVNEFHSLRKFFGVFISHFIVMMLTSKWFDDYCDVSITVHSWLMCYCNEMFHSDSSHLHTLTLSILRHCVSHIPLSAALNKMASCAWYRHCATNWFKKKISSNVKLACCQTH